MTSQTLRRRLHHGDVDGKRREHFDETESNGLDEPLLGRNHERDDLNSSVRILLTSRCYLRMKPLEGMCNAEIDALECILQELTLEEIWTAEQGRERLHWTLLFSQLIAHWAQWLANIVLSSGSLIGRILPFYSSTQNGSSKKLLLPSLSAVQEERLRNLQQRLGVPFDGSRVEHQDALKQLWRLAYPDRELPSLKSELWKEMGWQGADPSTDFRGGGFISLENLIYFAKKYPILKVPEDVKLVHCGNVWEVKMIPRRSLEVDRRMQGLATNGHESFQRLLLKKDGSRADWEYPFAVAGINISFMLAQMLDLQTGRPSTQAGIRFVELLAEDDMAFDNLYCVAFQMMDAQWLAKRASYMDFNDVLKSTRTQLERELAIEDVYSVKDLPAYNLLRG